MLWQPHRRFTADFKLTALSLIRLVYEPRLPSPGIPTASDKRRVTVLAQGSGPFDRGPARLRTRGAVGHVGEGVVLSGYSRVRRFGVREKSRDS